MASKVEGLYKRGNVWWCAHKSITGKIVRVSTKHSDYEEAIKFLTERKFNVQKEIEEPEMSKIINYAFRDLATKYDEWSVRQRGYDKKSYFINDLVNVFGDYQIKNFNTLMIENFKTNGYNGVTNRSMLKGLSVS